MLTTKIEEKSFVEEPLKEISSSEVSFCLLSHRKAKKDTDVKGFVTSWLLV